MNKHGLRLKAAAVFLVAAGVVVYAVNELRVVRISGRFSLPPVEYENLAPHYDVTTVGELPESVASIACERDGPNSHLLYVGTRGNAGVYRVGPRSPFTVSPLIPATGGQPEFGTASVSSLALIDFDRDGQEELIALTSQETPRGKSRAYIIGPQKLTQEMTAVDIPSSWPHGIAFVRDVFNRPTFLSAYCGYGEVVEFRLFDRKSPTGFRSHGLESRKLGNLSASGEQIASANLFGTGTHVVIARGFKFNSAGIEIHGRDRLTPFRAAKPGVLGLGWKRMLELRENDRYGNVRFIVGRLRDGVRDLYAWWCVGLADGDTEFVHYRLDQSGVVERRVLPLGPAHDYWPEENRIALVDADGDGLEELYFSTRSGNFWRMDAGANVASGDPETTKPTPPSLVARFPAGGGPLVAAGRQPDDVRPLYLGVGTHVVKITPKKSERGAPFNDPADERVLDNP
jgi:hypothetical protein